MKKPKQPRKRGLHEQASRIVPPSKPNWPKGGKNKEISKFRKSGDGEENNDWMQKYLDKLSRWFGK